MQRQYKETGRDASSLQNLPSNEQEAKAPLVRFISLD